MNLSDANGFASDYISLIPDKHKKNDPLPAHLPESLTYAIKCFLLVCAARRARGQVNKHNSMLIHVSRYVVWQDRMSKLTDETLKYYQRQIEFNQGALWEELKSIWEKDFQPTTADVLHMAAENPNGFQDPNIVTLPWDIIATHLFPAVSKIEVRAVHGDKKVAGLSYHNISPLDYFQAEQEKPPRYLSIIAVGGDKLSRGLTLEGLSISYYLRASKMYDTLMQMGRWFGYRPGYVDLCRLFTSSELISWYKHITIASEEVRADFDRMFLLKQTPKQFGLKVRTHPGVLKITAINKFRYHRIERLSYSAELEQTHRFTINESLFYNNLQALQTLLNQLGQPGKATNTESQRKKHFVWQTNALLVNEFLSTYRIGREVMDTAKLVDYIEKQNPHGSLVDWTVVLINNSSKDSRKEFFPINGQQTEVGLTRRGNAEAEGSAVYSIAKAQLISPQDEFIDLTDTQQQTALEETQADWEKKDRKGIPSYPSTFRIKYNRPANQGLLLIYPLDPEVEVTIKINDIKTKSVQTLGPIPIISFAVSFPNIEHDEKVEYAVNEQFIPDYDYDDLFDQEENE